MYQHESLPRARQDGLLEEAVGEELLLYDQESHVAHCLSPVAAGVWRHCDGEHDMAELAVLAGVSEELAAGAVYELREKDLLAAEPELTQSVVPGESRREVIVRVARYGAAAAAGSMIVSATAATPAMASSGEEWTELTKEEKEEKEKLGPLKCEKKAAAKNCCECKNAIAYGPGLQPSCETWCTMNMRGGYKAWTKEAVIV